MANVRLMQCSTNACPKLHVLLKPRIIRGNEDTPNRSSIVTVANVAKDRQRFGLDLTGLTLSKPNRLSLYRFELLKPEPNWSRNWFMSPVWNQFGNLTIILLPLNLNNIITISDTNIWWLWRHAWQFPRFYKTPCLLAYLAHGHGLPSALPP